MDDKTEYKNQLYPVFLKLKDLKTLLVGAGNVGLEKLQSLLSNSPVAAITVVATVVKQEVKDLLEKHPSCNIIERKFEYSDLEQKDIVILASDDKDLHKEIREEARKRNLLINVADTPELCDFYLGSIVQKGYVKLAISTNGMSPTISKRLKEVLNDVLPDELDEVIEQLNEIRSSLKGDFTEKVQKLNEITKQLTTRK